MNDFSTRFPKVGDEPTDGLPNAAELAAIQNEITRLAGPLEERRSDMPRRVRFECDMNAVPLPLEVANPTYASTLKRWFDAAVALVAIVVLLPVLAGVALAIKQCDGGPILFVQNRTGYLGKRFRLFKFRTMVVNAEELKQGLQAQNIHGDSSPDFKLRDDPRITRIGGFLRRTSLDELPNLFNVVRGEMALVGPRPTSFDAGTYSMRHLPRLAVRPGLTGLWQTSGRANIGFDQRSDLDISYIRRMSFIFDLSLIVRTIKAIRKGDGAM
jgi:lipopolysaccharide/colanic/teichoic acid biosynthesis glycosyltransferase